MKTIRLIRQSAAALIIAAVALAGCKKDSGDDDPPAEPLAVTFDRAEYYPFDVAIVRLSEVATAETYEGALGGQPVTAVRYTDTTLVVVLPDLAPAEYTLTLKMGEAAAEGKFRVKALPAVENPEAVIEEIKTSFAGILAEAEADSDPNAPLLKALIAAFDKQTALMTAAERNTFAAVWQAHPEWNGLQAEEMARRGFADDLWNAVTDYAWENAKMARAVGVFGVCATAVGALTLTAAITPAVATAGINRPGHICSQRNKGCGEKRG